MHLHEELSFFPPIKEHVFFFADFSIPPASPHCKKEKMEICHLSIFRRRVESPGKCTEGFRKFFRKMKRKALCAVQKHLLNNYRRIFTSAFLFLHFHLCIFISAFSPLLFKNTSCNLLQSVLSYFLSAEKPALWRVSFIPKGTPKVEVRAAAQKLRTGSDGSLRQRGQSIQNHYLCKSLTPESC